MLGLLEGLRQNRALLSARLGADSEWFNTALLGVDATSGELVLDELVPKEGHEQLREGSTLHVVGVLHGVPTHFSTQVRSIGSARGIAFYRAAVPKKIEYRQRRANFRVPIRRGLSLNVRLIDAESRLLPGRLLDLSLGGFGAKLRDANDLEPFDVVTVDALELPDCAPVSCKAELRYLQYGEFETGVRAGFRYIDLDPAVERSMLRAILNLERALIRQQAR